MSRTQLLRASLALAFLLPAGKAAENTDYQWNLPKGFPKPFVPADNPMSTSKVELGRYLFYDKRISVNGTESCASCHKQELAFTDGRSVAIGATGELNSRSAMSLVNVAYAGVLTWGNPELKSLEKQALTPMFGEHPVELGLREGDGFLPALRSDKKYQALFAQAFPSEADPCTIANVTKAIASFERSIISARSPYDRYHYDRDDAAVSESARHGEVLFFSQRISCFRCHSGFNFSDATVTAANVGREIEFHNTGLYNPPGAISYPAPAVGSAGIYEFTHVATDTGKFKTPTLRNIALTAPYMHDGSIATLEGVLDHYAAGGRAHNNPNKDPLIGGFPLSPQDRADMIEYLKTLTDDQVIHDPRFSDPWPAEKH